MQSQAHQAGPVLETSALHVQPLRKTSALRASGGGSGHGSHPDNGAASVRSSLSPSDCTSTVQCTINAITAMLGYSASSAQLAQPDELSRAHIKGTRAYEFRISTNLTFCFYFSGGVGLFALDALLRGSRVAQSGPQNSACSPAHSRRSAAAPERQTLAKPSTAVLSRPLLRPCPTSAPFRHGLND
ncbi:hypothetical protein PaG_02427 [Moesziomyces aphidis]|uniref:Uncharacterized protein n=1 Tax=Moesziomyces aphidis TaxID=84754 RepID=W3VPK4_MOEAP|nr:hypothetical protein PaG_02427 [Moesziomyces aphidis]